MKYSRTNQSRISVIRLEDGEVVHEVIEDYAAPQSIALLPVILGCADEESTIVVGHRNGQTPPLEPMMNILQNVHEVAGVGTVFPDAERKPALHIHMAVAGGQKK